jgi:hypothetical protein
MAAMTNGRSFVSALRLRAVSICVRRLRLLEVIGVNLLLSLSQYGERGESPYCEHES